MPNEMSKVQIPLKDVTPIVGDGAMAGPVADGRMIPVLILETAKHLRFQELLRIHHQTAPGDVEFAWGGTRGSMDEVLLLLKFWHPMELQVALIFSIEKQGGLVDLMLSSRAVYLQGGVKGDRLATTMENRRILVELPSTGYEEHWQDIYIKRMTEVIRSRAGLSRREAKKAAQDFISQMREVDRFRMS